MAVAGEAPNGLCRAGTCMGIDPMPIWTDGTEVGDPTAGIRGLVEGATACEADAAGAATGGGVAIGSCIGPAPGGGGRTEVGMMVGPTAEKVSGWGGTAVFATLVGAAGMGSGGGVGGYASGGGTGLGAGAAPA